ncbi:MAG: hypothetical protein KAI47_20940 [Deltaproteobacteria bacterium]|nr:hypothetical protein [Deltaproteobacteria bacterium]
MWHKILTAGISPDTSREELRLLRFHRLSVLLLLWISPVFAFVALAYGNLPIFGLILGAGVGYGIVFAMTVRPCRPPTRWSLPTRSPIASLERTQAISSATSRSPDSDHPDS